MIHLTRFYLIFLFLLSLCIIQAQQTFVKSFKTYNDPFEFGNTVLIDGENIYIAARGNCLSNGCAITIQLDNKGSVSWTKKDSITYGGNNNSILCSNDTIILGSFETWANIERKFHLIMSDKNYGKDIKSFEYNFDTLSINGVNSEGIIKYQNQYLIYGEYRNFGGIASGLIQWASLDGTPIRTTTYRLEGNKTVNALQDLQEDGYGNLVFVTVYIDQNFDNSSVIRKLDRNGKIINDVYITSDNSLEPRPQLCVNKNKQYVFSHSIDDLPEFIGDVQQIVCTDTSGNVIWLHNYPWKIVGQQPINWSNNYKIRQITATSDGGVIVTATIRTNRIQNRFYDDAYVGKFDSFGTLEWERRINILDDRDTLYDYCALYDIKERPDGLGYIAVGSHTPSDNLQTTNILLVSLDRDGCIEGLTCDDNHLVISTDDIVDVAAHHDQPKINPNPFTDILNVESGGSKRIRIFDINGNIIVDQKTALGITSFETTTWNTGMYIVNLISSNGNMKSYKIVKK